jgi:hypothetical protein
MYQREAMWISFEGTSKLISCIVNLSQQLIFS